MSEAPIKSVTETPIVIYTADGTQKPYTALLIKTVYY